MACFLATWVECALIFIYISVSVCKVSHIYQRGLKCSDVTPMCEELLPSHFSVCIPAPDLQHLSLLPPSCYTDRQTERFFFFPLSLKMETDILIYRFFLSAEKYSQMWTQNNNVAEKHNCWAGICLLKKKKAGLIFFSRNVIKARHQHIYAH